MIKVRNKILFVMVVFLFQEIVFRVCFPIPMVTNFNRVDYQVLENDKYQDPDLFLENRTWESSLDTDYVFVHRFNEYGFRDHSWSIKKQENKKRILFIGDSFVEGVMADDDQTIPAYYQGLVGNDFDVMNAGMNGTGISSYMKLMKDIIPIFKPDEVKLVLYANDFSPIKVRTYEPLIPEFSSSFSPRLIEIIKRLINNKPVVFRWMRKTYPFLFPIPDQSNPFSYRAHELVKHVTPEVKRAMADATMNYYIINLLAKKAAVLTTPVSFKEELSAIKQVCQKNQAMLKVYYLPGRHQVTDNYLKFDQQSCLIYCKDQQSLTGKKFQLHAQILKDDCASLNVDYYDFTSKLADLERDINLHWNYDEHMKSSGYYFIANQIYSIDDNTSIH